MKSDVAVRRDVEAQLRWAPDVDETDIEVKVNQGAVTLSGFVHDYRQKYLAEVAVKQIKGVTAIANDIEVKLLSSVPTDPEIARSAAAALQLEIPAFCEQLQATVKQGSVCLDGAVEWQYQRDAAERAVRRIHGVTSVSNRITIKPTVQPQNIKGRIEDAFRRMAQVDAGRIMVDSLGSQVTLRGEVRSWPERDEAERTAWSAPGVTNVMNQLNVRS